MIFHKKINFAISFIVASLIASGLTGCSSSKKTVTPQRATAISTPLKPKQKTRSDIPSRGLRDDQQRLVDEAMTWLGVPYRFGGKDHSGADCSGLTMMVYKTALDIKIPRNSAEQQKFCRHIAKNDLEVGDLVFFCTGKDKQRVSHVGIYLGAEKFIHASSTKGVVISSISDNYFTRTYHSSGHVTRDSDSPREPATMETTPLHFEFDEDELDRAIEQRIDSIF